MEDLTEIKWPLTLTDVRLAAHNCNEAKGLDSHCCSHSLQCESKKTFLPKVSGNCPQQLRIFKQNFTCL